MSNASALLAHPRGTDNAGETAIKTGRWTDRETGIEWLSDARAGEFLKEGVEIPHCLFLKQPVLSWRTVRKIGKLFERKRAVLLPDDPNCPCSCEMWGTTWHNRTALRVMKDWLTMPKGEYVDCRDNDPKKPRRDLYTAAAFVGCDTQTIMGQLDPAPETSKAVKDWSRNGKGEINTYKQDDLQGIIDKRNRFLDGGVRLTEDGKKRYTLAAVAKALEEKTGSKWSADKVKLALGNREKSQEMNDRAKAKRKKAADDSGRKQRDYENGYTPRGVGIAAKPELVPQWGHGSAYEISEEELGDLIAAVMDEGMKRREGYLIEHELVALVRENPELSKSISSDPESITAPLHIVVHQCLVGWEQAALLLPVKAIVEKAVDYKHNGETRQRQRTHLLDTYNKEAFVKLWKSTAPKRGMAQLCILLPKVGLSMVTEELLDAMKTKGFVGVRLWEAMRLARVISYQVNGLRGDPYLSERLPSRSPENSDARAVIERIIPKGPVASVKAIDAARSMRLAGLLRKERLDALKHHGIKVRRWHPRGEAVGPRYLCWPGQRPPSRSEEEERQGKADQPTGNGTINGHQQPPADNGTATGGGDGRQKTKKTRGRKEGSTIASAQRQYRKIRKLHEKGFTPTEIADKIGTTRTTVYRAFKSSLPEDDSEAHA